MDFTQFYKPAKKRRGVECGANIHLSPDGKACVYLTMPKDEDTRGCYYWLIPLKAKDMPDGRDCLYIHNGCKDREDWLKGRPKTINKNDSVSVKGMTLYVALADVPKRLRPTPKKPKIVLHVTKTARGGWLLRLPVDVQQVITYVD